MSKGTKAKVCSSSEEEEEHDKGPDDEGNGSYYPPPTRHRRRRNRLIKEINIHPIDLARVKKLAKLKKRDPPLTPARGMEEIVRILRSELSKNHKGERMEEHVQNQKDIPVPFHVFTFLSKRKISVLDCLPSPVRGEEYRKGDVPILIFFLLKDYLFVASTGSAWSKVQRFVDHKFMEKIPMKILNEKGATAYRVRPVIGIECSREVHTKDMMVNLSELEAGDICLAFKGHLRDMVTLVLFPHLENDEDEEDNEESPMEDDEDSSDSSEEESDDYDDEVAGDSDKEQEDESMDEQEDDEDIGQEEPGRSGRPKHWFDSSDEESDGSDQEMPEDSGKEKSMDEDENSDDDEEMILEEIPAPSSASSSGIGSNHEEEDESTSTPSTTAQPPEKRERDPIAVDIGEGRIKFHTKLSFWELTVLIQKLYEVYLDDQYNVENSGVRRLTTLVSSDIKETILDRLGEDVINAIHGVVKINDDNPDFAWCNKFFICPREVGMRANLEAIRVAFKNVNSKVGGKPSLLEILGTLGLKNADCTKYRKKGNVLKDIKLKIGKLKARPLRYFLQGTYKYKPRSGDDELEKQWLWTVGGKWYTVPEDYLRKIQDKFEEVDKSLEKVAAGQGGGVGGGTDGKRG